MALTETRPETADPAPVAVGRAGPGPLERLIGSGDHTSIGRLFVGFSLVLTVVALAVRALAGIDALTDNGFLGERTAMLADSSLVALVLIGVMPLLLGLAIGIVPLQVASPSIAFPRAAALSLWTWLISAGVFITSVALDGGVGGSDTDAARLGSLSMGAMMVALVLGSVCVATTVVAHRPMGMGLARIPLFAWSMLAASALWIATLASAVAHVALGQIRHDDATALGQNFTEGLAWIVRGPSVYILAIPVLGIAADTLGTATGRRITRYGTVQAVIGAFAVLSFGAWAQLPASVETIVWTAFALAIGLVLLAMLGAVADVLRGGPVQLSAAMMLGLLSLLLVLGAVVCGLLLALDLAGTDSLFGLNARALSSAQAYFVVSAGLGGGLAGLFAWSPQMWGGRISGSTGNAVAALVFLGGGLLATSQLVQGVVQIDGKDSGAQLFGALTALGALALSLGVLGGFQASLGAARDAADGAEEEADGLTMEWAFPSPAMGGSVPDDLPEVISPYPLLDAREPGTADTEDA